MIWLTWRQFRAQAWVTSAALAVFAVALVVTGLRLAHLYDTSGIAACHAQAHCQTLAANFLQGLKNSHVYSTVYFADVAVLLAVPAVIGASGERPW